jgi:hypothetical protein
VPELHEAYLVKRRRPIDRDRVRIGLGVVARVGSRWRGAPKQVAAVREALKPFSPPGDTALLPWGNDGNDSVPEEETARGHEEDLSSLDAAAERLPNGVTPPATLYRSS